MIQIPLIIALFFALFSDPVFAGTPEILSVTERVFKVTDPLALARGSGEAESGCRLTRVVNAQFGYPGKNQLGGVNESYLGASGTLIETTDASCAPHFVVVQWIRGCIYSDTYHRSTGRIDSRFGISKDHRGRGIAFQIRDWEPDSASLDPIYWASESPSQVDPKRTEDYVVPTTPVTSVDSRAIGRQIEALVNTHPGGHAYDFSRPRRTPFQVFVRDMPTGAHWSPNEYDSDVENATQISLEFQTCIYRAEDVPLRGDPARFDQKEKGPIVCFPWNLRKRWNFKTHGFETPSRIDRFCRS